MLKIGKNYICIVKCLKEVFLDKFVVKILKYREERILDAWSNNSKILEMKNLKVLMDVSELVSCSVDSFYGICVKHLLIFL